MDKLDDYKTVLVIGNGFDKNIGMPTSYKEFMGSEEFKDLFKELGTKLIYLDAGKTIEFSKQQAREFYHDNF